MHLHVGAKATAGNLGMLPTRLGQQILVKLFALRR